MTGRRKRKREAPISYRPPKGLSEEFRARVRDSGLSINAYITLSVFGQAAPRSPRRPPLDQKLAAMLLSQAARLNSRLDEAAPASGDTNRAALLAECRSELAEIRGYLMLALGRDP